MSETPLQSIEQGEQVSHCITKKRSRAEIEKHSPVVEVEETEMTCEVPEKNDPFPKKSKMETVGYVEKELASSEQDSLVVPSSPVPDELPVLESSTPTSSPSQEDMVALLIPSHMLNSSLLAPHLQNSSTPSLQVLRQFLTLYTWPAPPNSRVG